MKPLSISIMILGLGIILSTCVGTPPEQQELVGDPLFGSDDMEMMANFRLSTDDPRYQTFAEELGITDEDSAFIEEQLQGIRELVQPYMDQIEKPFKWKEILLADTIDKESILTTMDQTMNWIPELIPQVQPYLNTMVSYFSQEQRQTFVDKMNAHHQEKMEKHEAHKERMERQINSFLDLLELTEAQKEEIDSLRTQLQTEMETHGSTHKGLLMDSIHTAILSGGISTEFLTTLWNDQHTMMRNHFSTMLDFAQEFHQILTAEQRETLVNTIKQRQRHMKGNRHNFFRRH